MRRLVPPVALALLVGAVPVGAEEPVTTTPCEASEEFPTLSVEGVEQAVTPSAIPAAGTDADDAARDFDVAAPDVPYHEQSAVSYQFRLDLSGSPTVPSAQTGNVTINLAWDNDGDYDLYLYDAAGKSIGEGANSFNPQTGAGESMMLSRAAHCTDFRVDIVNYLAPGPVTGMELSAKVSSLKP